MHGRIKVRTTAEQQDLKRKEREKKSAAFSAGMKQVLRNRYDEENELEVLKVTEKLLSGNPDVATLWNIRKEIFTRKIGKNENEEASVNLQQLFLKELQFLQNCLHVNPKSYAVFNHRVYVMKNMNSPKWDEEIKLCDLFLKYDERNFHCWDYRRFVVKNNSNISPENELDFTMKKITDNFSNYSAWHNRSKLLPKIHKSESLSENLKQEVIEKELDLARNAFFTDPNDQTAWIYQRWLLGRKVVPLQLLSIIFQRKPSFIIISLSRPVNFLEMSNNVFKINGEIKYLKWQTLASLYNKKSQVKHSCIWVAKYCCSNENIEVNISLKDIPDVNDELILGLSNPEENQTYISWNKDQLMKENARFVRDSKVEVNETILQNELTQCQELLDLEPDIKWIILTIVFLMQAIDIVKYQNDIEKHIDKLINIDPMRKGYYKDLRNRYGIERLIETIANDRSSIDILDLSQMNLSKLYYTQYFTPCKKIVFGKNDVKPSSFLNDLPNLEELHIENEDNINQKMCMSRALLNIFDVPGKFK